MENKIDSRYVTNEFLLEYYPSGTRFGEIMDPLRSTLEVSKQIYISTRNDLNQRRKRSGKSPLSDADIVDFIEHQKGILQMPKILKPNKSN